ncbi:hypothetical protein PTSG_05206 [Salpingoeca rosetta]|uniref:Uncharacterized protein n=1 Tax=Salpingoeca rosetta (strain ATCC 50818 / BSB-021) TaxID=946362 RepID=F2UAT7_SALR5|nr:uncharacterized protein PTSG_05206 [Salpingoeca rosetta]EGD73503.1 hypothetical protein PTSG_05206 [Salpingoeca rosetta]|eukprot:XP_004993785.1 hypothetical protein PTSG_05206 [Salpingoeca rosetta]
MAALVNQSKKQHYVQGEEARLQADVLVLMEVLQMAAKERDVDQVCQVLNTALGLVKQSSSADAFLAKLGFFAYALRLCDRFSDQVKLSSCVLQLFRASATIDDSCLRLLVSRVKALQLMRDKEGVALLGQQAVVQQACASEVRRAQYGQDLVSMLLERCLMIRADDNEDVWAIWTQQLRLLIQLIQQPSVNPQFQEQVLPLVEAIFEEGLLLRTELKEETRLDCCWLAAAVTQNNVNVQTQLSKHIVEQTLAFLELLLKRHSNLAASATAAPLQFLADDVAVALGKQRLFVQLMDIVASSSDAAQLIEAALQAWSPKTEAECKIVMQAVRSASGSDNAVPGGVADGHQSWVVIVRAKSKEVREAATRAQRHPLPMFFPTSRTFRQHPPQRVLAPAASRTMHAAQSPFHINPQRQQQQERSHPLHRPHSRVGQHAQLHRLLWLSPHSRQPEPQLRQQHHARHQPCASPRLRPRLPLHDSSETEEEAAEEEDDSDSSHGSSNARAKHVRQVQPATAAVTRGSSVLTTTVKPALISANITNVNTSVATAAQHPGSPAPAPPQEHVRSPSSTSGGTNSSDVCGGASGDESAAPATPPTTPSPAAPQCVSSPQAPCPGVVAHAADAPQSPTLPLLSSSPPAHHSGRRVPSQYSVIKMPMQVPRLFLSTQQRHKSMYRSNTGSRGLGGTTGRRRQHQQQQREDRGRGRRQLRRRRVAFTPQEDEYIRLGVKRCVLTSCLAC